MILDGKLVASKIKALLKEEVETRKPGARSPHLIIITIGEDPASQVYVRNKIKACAEVGITVEHKIFTATDSVYTIKNAIERYNFDHTVDGIMVQLPVPEGFDERTLIDTILPQKDVDGLTTTNIGRLRSGQACLYPCTAQGIIDLLDYYDIEITGKDITVIGRSNIVGKPVADMLMARGATVTQCHSKTRDLTLHTIPADIIVSAVGVPKLLTRDHILKGITNTIIDVGINRDENGKLCGDVDFEQLQDRVNAITPVPGGVGPMTVAELMKNTVTAWRRQCAY